MPRLVGSSLLGRDVVFPTSYKIDYINLTNHAGVTIDIQNLVTDFSISESIYMPGLMLSVSVKDSVNFLEEFQLSGQEKIDILVSRKKEFGSSEDIKLELEFYVTEYPTYGKFANHLQVYKIRGVSEHLYRSKFHRISRAYVGTTHGFAYDVLTRDLNYNPDWIYSSGRDTHTSSFIVPNLAPIEAIAWALRRSFDQTGSPWYCYETMEGGISIVPQSELVTGDIFRTFKEGKFFQYLPNTAEDYRERQQRILSLASDLRMSKYIAGANGAYGSTSEYVDISTKTRGRWRFNYLDDYDEMMWLNKNKSNLDPDFGFDQRSLATMSNALINYIPINSKAFKDTKNFHSGTLDGRINRAQSYLDNLDNVTHDLKVAGDFGLSAGKVVELLVSQSIDPTVTVKGAKETNPIDRYDDALSGRHLITSVVHNFAEEYFCEMKIKKDSVSVSYYE